MGTVYEFTFSNATTLDVSIAPVESEITGVSIDGAAVLGYAITGVSGMYNGASITGIYGSIAAYSSTLLTDNAIFPTNGTGAPPTGGSSGTSLDGIDIDGIGFTVQGGPPTSIYYYGGNGGWHSNVEGTGQFPLTLTNFQTVVSSNCFASGTKILTVAGEKKVEEIEAGEDIVTVREGGPMTRRVIWTGRRRVRLDSHPEPETVRPIRIVAGAISDGVPARDLRVSPCHGIYLDGVLFEAGTLVNGVTIFQEPRGAEVVYHHIELEAHDIVLAEGCAAESYLETGTRGAFEGASVMALFPDFRPWARGAFCVPVIRGGAALAAMQARLEARAAEAA